jgi:hypothetical protein
VKKRPRYSRSYWLRQALCSQRSLPFPLTAVEPELRTHSSPVTADGASYHCISVVRHSLYTLNEGAGWRSRATGILLRGSNAKALEIFVNDVHRLGLLSEKKSVPPIRINRQPLRQFSSLQLEISSGPFRKLSDRTIHWRE